MSREGLGAALLLALALGAGGCGGGADHLVVTPSAIDFGPVLEGEAPEVTVRILNGGAQPVTVTHTGSNCSCFPVSSLLLRTLQPGEEREVTVRFVTTGRPSGPIKGKKLDVVSDDPVSPRIEVPIEAEVVVGVTLAPSRVALGPLEEPQSRAAQTVRIAPGPGMRLDLVDWRLAPADLFEAKVEEVDAGYEITFNLEAEAKVDGHLNAALEVRVGVEGRGFARRVRQYVVPIGER